MQSATLDAPRLAETDESLHETNGHGTPEVEQAAQAAADEAPDKEPIPAPTPAELRAAHYAEIVAESVLVEEARHDYEEAAAETKRLKKEYEGAASVVSATDAPRPVAAHVAGSDARRVLGLG